MMSKNPLQRIALIPHTEEDRYEVMYHFTAMFSRALEKLGVTTSILLPNQILALPAAERPDLTIQFNDCPYMPDGQLFCDVSRIPHVALLVDPPFRVLQMVLSPYIYFTCDDRNWDDYLDKIGFHRHLFLPHAADKDTPSGEEEKTYDVAMLATCIDYEKTYDAVSKSVPPFYRLAFMLAAKKALSDSEVSHYHAFADYEERMVPKRERGKVLIPFLMRLLEVYIKGVDRTELVKAVKGATVHVYGKPFPSVSWDKYLGGRENVVLHSGVAFDGALDVMRRTKVLLNSSVKNKYGGHERIFTGILCGALVVTHENPYLTQYFKDEESILFYRHSELDKLNAKIMKYLQDEDARLRIVEKGREIVLSQHTWDHRAKSLIDWYIDKNIKMD